MKSEFPCITYGNERKRKPIWVIVQENERESPNFRMTHNRSCF